jgi:hypothetical protein
MEAFCIGLVCGWELVAYSTRQVPTVTNLVMRLPHGPRAVVVAAIWVWTVVHFELRGNRG